jgi:PhoH-like ATPase
MNKSFDKYFVVDTNIILEDFTNIAKLSDEGNNLIILPEIVLDEIDSKKSGFEEINYQARKFARFLEDSHIKESKEEEGHKIVYLEVDDVNLIIISKEIYKTDTKQISLSISNDIKILEIALFANSYFEKTIQFISNDIMARVRATSLDLETTYLKGDGKDDTELEFEKTITINFEDLETIQDREIIELDPEYQPYIFSYCLKVKNSDQVVLCAIKNGKINVLDEVSLREQIVTPLNKEQLFFSHSLQDPHYNIIIVEAKAGSGKTLLGLSSAIKLVRKKTVSKNHLY